ncbi:MAG: YceI family protein [Ktedonobacteraceae bacterium]|nr:YceI family protein [Ktedonobacteraceae bacterium]
MKKRYIRLAAISVVIVGIVIGVLVYTSRFASTVSQTHTASGPVVPSPTAAGVATAANGASTSSTGPKTFQIMPAQTTASYSVDENLIFQNKPHNDAVGTTHSVQGNFRIQTGASPLVDAMNVKVDLSTLQTDSQMRDNYVRKHALETDMYPDATFISVSTQGLPTSYNDGESVHFQLTGNLTMHGKTNKEVFDVQGKVVDKTVTGMATSTIYMTDFGIQPPNLANVAISQNKVLVTINFTAKEA